MVEPAIEDLARRVRLLERSNRRWRAIAAVGLAAAGVAAWGGARAAPRPPAAVARLQEAAGDPEATVEAQRALASRSLAMIERSLERGVAETRSTGAAYAFSIRLLASELYLSLPPDGPRTLDPEVYLAADLSPATPDRLASFEAHRDRMRRWEDLFRPLIRDRVLSPLDYAELQYRRLEAETLLARERRRLDGPPADAAGDGEEGPGGSPP